MTLADRHLGFALGIAGRYLDVAPAIDAGAELVFLHPAAPPPDRPAPQVTTVYDIHNITRYLTENNILNLNLLLRFTGGLLEKTVRESARIGLRQINMLKKRVEVLRRENRALTERTAAEQSQELQSVPPDRQETATANATRQTINLETIAALLGRYEQYFAAFDTGRFPGPNRRDRAAKSMDLPARSDAGSVLSAAPAADRYPHFALGPATLTHLTGSAAGREAREHTEMSRSRAAAPRSGPGPRAADHAEAAPKAGNAPTVADARSIHARSPGAQRAAHSLQPGQPQALLPEHAARFQFPGQMLPARAVLPAAWAQIPRAGPDAARATGSFHRHIAAVTRSGEEGSQPGPPAASTPAGPVSLWRYIRLTHRLSSEDAGGGGALRDLSGDAPGTGPRSERAQAAWPDASPHSVIERLQQAVALPGVLPMRAQSPPVQHTASADRRETPQPGWIPAMRAAANIRYPASTRVSAVQVWPNHAESGHGPIAPALDRPGRIRFPARLEPTPPERQSPAPAQLRQRPAEREVSASPAARPIERRREPPSSPFPLPPAPTVYRQENLPPMQRELWEVLLERQPAAGAPSPRTESATQAGETPAQPAAPGSAPLQHGHPLLPVQPALPLVPPEVWRMGEVPAQIGGAAAPLHHPSVAAGEWSAAFGPTDTAGAPAAAQRTAPPQPAPPLVYRREAAVAGLVEDADDAPDIEFVTKTTTRTVREQQTRRETVSAVSSGGGGSGSAEVRELWKRIESPEAVGRMADRVYRILERRLRTERLRKGLL